MFVLVQVWRSNEVYLNPHSVPIDLRVNEILQRHAKGESPLKGSCHLGKDQLYEGVVGLSVTPSTSSESRQDQENDWIEIDARLSHCATHQNLNHGESTLIGSQHPWLHQ